VSRAIADTSVFIAREARRPLGDLPDEIAVSVITAAELEFGVLRARDPSVRAARLATLARVLATYPMLPIDDATASSCAQLGHGAAVATQDADFSSFTAVDVIRL
jgi:toxin FitB